MRVHLGGRASIGPTIEGWTLRDATGRVESRGPLGERRPALFGAAAAITAGVLLPAWRATRAVVRVAARAELAVSALPDVRVWLPIRTRAR